MLCISGNGTLISNSLLTSMKVHFAEKGILSYLWKGKFELVSISKQKKNISMYKNKLIV